MYALIDKLLSHVYEIEGLILVAKRMGDDTPDIVVDKIQRKVRELATMVGADEQPTAAVADEPGTREVPVADREPDEDIDVEFIMPEDEPDLPEVSLDAPDLPAHNDEPVPDPDPEILPEAMVLPGKQSVTDYTEAPMPEAKPEQPAPPTPTEFPAASERPEPLRVDEKLHRSQAQDIRKALSVNDRFRFQRELFAGSADALNNAIAHIEMMNSYGNAELFFYSQLGWDREDEVVKDFMSIVRNHFQK